MEEVREVRESKPPIGITPRWIYDRLINTDRITDILDAMERYSNRCMYIPTEWIEELRDRISTNQN